MPLWTKISTYKVLSLGPLGREEQLDWSSCQNNSPDGDNKPGKFDMDLTMVAYKNDDNSCTLIDGKLFKELPVVA